MAEPTLAVTRLAGSESADDVLVVGAGLGTAVEPLWGLAASGIGDRVEVLGVDLPGHGQSPATDEPFTVADLASAVRGLAAQAAAGRPVWYAGVSLAGAVAIELAMAPGPFRAVAALAAAARFGEPDEWHERADLVRRAGTPMMVSGSAERWFAPGFVDRDPATANRLLLALSEADDASYACCCEALAEFDASSRLGSVTVPLLVGPGELDAVVTVDAAEAAAAAAPGARLHVFEGCAHQPPAEMPYLVAEVLTGHFWKEES
jgi:pimeloyl-ACP methyl ester carboxylesterase